MTPEKTREFKNWVRRVERSNKRFDQASSADRILMVAQDVLSLLDLGRLRVKSSNGYVDLPKVPEVIAEFNANDFETASEEVSLQDILKMPTASSCTVCAIGAGMVASTLRLNGVSVPKGDLQGGGYESYGEDLEEGTMSHCATSVFGSDLLHAMEYAFENGLYFYDKIERDRTRLRAIYQNLVNNNGERFTCYRDPEITVWSLELGLVWRDPPV